MAFEKASAFEKAIALPATHNWTPPGELIKTFKHGGKTLEIWKGTLADAAIKQMVKRVQILVPLFIDGGSVIDLEDSDWLLQRWTVFFLYQKADEAQGPYTFMGYSTVFRYYHFLPDKSAKDKVVDFSLPLDSVPFSSLPCRTRISQFLILPPFQAGGNGSQFYNVIFDHYLAEPETLEITVEDPNYGFDDMRDLNDLARLRALPEFQAIKINTQVKPDRKGVVPNNIVDELALESLRKKIKIAPRQFLRVVEMHLLSGLPKSLRTPVLIGEAAAKIPAIDEPRTEEYHLWTLWVKKRLWKHNRDSLLQLDKESRLDHLGQVLSAVLDDYARLLDAYDARVKKTGQASSNVSEDTGSKLPTTATDPAPEHLTVDARAQGKRPSPSDGDESSAKKTKVSEEA